MNRFLDKKYVNTGFLIALLILVFVNVIVYLNIKFHFDDEKIIAKSLKIIQTSSELYSKTIEAETNRRGYLITSNLSFMQAYYPLTSSIDSLYTSLKQQTKENINESRLTDTLGLLIYNRMDLLEESLALQEKSSKDIKAQINFTSKGKETQDKIKQIIQKIQAEENTILNQRLAEAEADSNYAIMNLIIGNIIAFLLMIAGVFLLNRNISHRKKIEKTLNENRTWLATTLGSIGDGVIATNNIGEILFMNKKAEAITGWMQHEGKGMLLEHVFNIVNEETRAKPENLLRKVINAGDKINLCEETLLITKSNKEVPIDESASPIMGNDGRLQGVVIVFRDVSHKRQSEKELLSSQKFIKRIADSIPSIIYIYSLAGPKITFVNYKISDLLGYTSESVIAMKDSFFTKLIHPEDYARLTKLYQKYSTAMDNEVIEYEYRILNKKGEWRWFRSFDVVFSRTKDGHAMEMLGSVLDVTDKRKLEEQLKKYSEHLEELISLRTDELKSANNKLKAEINERVKAEINIIDAEEKFRSLVENSLVGIYIIQDNAYAYTNPKYDEIFGYSRGELFGTDIWKVIPGASKKLVEACMSKIYGKETDSIQYFYKAEKKQGALIDVEVKETVMQYHGKTAIIGTLQDVTERMKAEDELNMQREYLRTVIDTDPNFVFAKDWDGKFTLVNKAVADVYDTTVNELIGKTDADFNPNSDEVEHFLKDDREVMGSDSSKFIPEEKVTNSKTGEVKWYQTIKVPLRAIDGTKQVLGVSADITARKLSEEITRKSLNEKELLLKEIHHRVKNNLQIIVSLLKLQSRYVKDPKDLHIFNSSRSRVETMSLIHEKLYKSKDLSDIDLGNYLKDLISHILNAYRISHEEIAFNIVSDKINLTIDTAIPCGLIINELINNTIKYAFPEGHKGSICVDIKKCGEDIILEVKDNGIGIPESFDIANSDSLGLQLVETLIKQINGTVTVESNGGTKFIIKFREIKYRERI